MSSKIRGVSRTFITVELCLQQVFQHCLVHQCLNVKAITVTENNNHDSSRWYLFFLLFVSSVLCQKKISNQALLYFFPSSRYIPSPLKACNRWIDTSCTYAYLLFHGLISLKIIFFFMERNTIKDICEKVAIFLYAKILLPSAYYWNTHLQLYLKCLTLSLFCINSIINCISKAVIKNMFLSS